MFKQFSKFKHTTLWLLLLFILPICFFVSFSATPLTFRPLFFVNDFTGNRIWWTQMDTYFISKGIFPFWNPTFEMGHPYLSISTGIGSLYPLRWWLYIPTYFGGLLNHVSQYLQISLHISIAMIGLFLINRRYLKSSQIAAATGAAFFILNQAFNNFIRFPHGIENISWIPVSLYLALRSFESKEDDNRFLVLFSLSVMLGMLTGYGQFSYYGALMILIFSLVFIRSIKFFLKFLLAGAVGILFSVGSIWPAYEWISQHSIRSGKDMQLLSLLGMTEYLNILINPFGVDVHVNIFGPVIFFGLILCGLISFFKNRKKESEIVKKINLALIINFVIFLDISRGSDGILFSIFYKFLPFFGAFNGPAKASWMLFIPFSFFIAKGFDYFKNLKNHSRIPAIIFILFILLLAVSSKSLVELQAQGVWQPIAAGWISPQKAKIMYLIFLLLSVVLFWFFALSKKLALQIIFLPMQTIIFVWFFCIYSNWVDRVPERDSLLSSKQAYPLGLLGPRTLKQATANNIGMTDPIVDPKLWKITHENSKLLVGDGESIPKAHFLWDSEDKSASSLIIEKFGPDILEFTVEATSAGKLVYLMKSSKYWTSSVPYTINSRFSDFYEFKLAPGKNKIKMEFKPITHYLSILITLCGFGILLVTSFCIWNLERRRAYSFICIVLVLCCITFVTHSYFIKKTLSFSDIFGTSVTNQVFKLESRSEL